MIYLDNAAGSWPKPPGVAAALAESLQRYGANPGRGNYEMTRRTEAMTGQFRRRLAQFIKAPDPSRIVFTAGATMSLNMALWGYLRPGDHVVYSGMEHNAAYRPLYALARAGRISISKAPADSEGYVSVKSMEKLLRPHTTLLVLNHASNVCGAVQPLQEVAELSRRRRIPLLVDAAQSAGLLPLDVAGLDIAMLALAGHKALYGPAGVGALYVREGLLLQPLISGGTGSESEKKTQPRQYPQHLEAGSLNTSGLAAWAAGLDMVESVGVQGLYQHGMGLLAPFIERLRGLPALRLYLPEQERPRLPVLALNMRGYDPAEVATHLDKQGFCLRSGYHCAPLAHRALGSFAAGSLRISPGWYNTAAEMAALADALSGLAAR